MQSSARTKAPENGAPYIIEHGVLTDIASPVDRRFLNEQFSVVMSRYRLDQNKLAEFAKLSSGTISNVATSGNKVAWTTWESLIAGLIQYHPNAALSFWLGLRPCIQDSIRKSTNNKVILDYIAELDKIYLLDEISVRDAIKSMLDQLEPEAAEKILSEVNIFRGYKAIHNETPRIPYTSNAETNTVPSLSGNVNYYFLQSVNNVNLNVFPQGIEMGNQDISALIQATLQNNGSQPAPVDPDQEKKSQ